jgi:NAD(P)-dependent dehydrogenase (short-subunit alcohol dehydrogenase family)
MVEQALEAFGQLDIVVNNAAVAPQQRISNLPEATLREAFEINYFGPVALTQAALPALRESGTGRLLYIISNGGLYGGDGLGAYASTKAALYALMRTMAVEGQRFGITANALAPFAVSQMTDQVMQGALREALGADWIGPVAAALCSPLCALTGNVYVTGAGRVREARVAETDTRQFAAGATPEAVLALLQGLDSAPGLHHFEHAVQGFFHSMGDLAAPA